MKLAAIDIGTNSTKMTLAETDQSGRIVILSEAVQITRLGAGVDAAKTLREDAMTRTLDVIAHFADTARAAGVRVIRAAGTSALRDAGNGPAFIARVQQRCGVDIEIITGDREAQLAYTAVRRDSDLRLPPDAPLLVFDIGGGSTELILGVGDTVQKHQSLNIGAVRLTERFFAADPPLDAQIAEASAFADTLLAKFPVSSPAPRIVGIGGTAVNLASVTRGLPKPDPNAVHAATLSAADVAAALAEFRAVTTEQRRHIPGLEPERADIIIGGALLLLRLLHHFQADRFTVSARGLRYGLIAEATQSD